MLNFYLLLWVLSTANGSEYDRLEAFVGDAIQSWQLISPTIIVGNDLFRISVLSIVLTYCEDMKTHHQKDMKMK